MRMVYKCRLCGEVFCTGYAGKPVVEKSMAYMVAGLVDTTPMAPTLIATHYCGGDHAGSLGLADFQGWEKEAAENE